jgi:hypothetical protein
MRRVRSVPAKSDRAALRAARLLGDSQEVFVPLFPRVPPCEVLVTVASLKSNLVPQSVAPFASPAYRMQSAAAADCEKLPSARWCRSRLQRIDVVDLYDHHETEVSRRLQRPGSRPNRRPIRNRRTPARWRRRQRAKNAPWRRRRDSAGLKKSRGDHVSAAAAAVASATTPAPPPRFLNGRDPVSGWCVREDAIPVAWDGPDRAIRRPRWCPEGRDPGGPDGAAGDRGPGTPPADALRRSRTAGRPAPPRGLEGCPRPRGLAARKPSRPGARNLAAGERVDRRRPALEDAAQKTEAPTGVGPPILAQTVEGQVGEPQDRAVLAGRWEAPGDRAPASWDRHQVECSRLRVDPVAAWPRSGAAFHLAER